MQKIKGLLLIGGSAKNSGKTSFAVAVIKHFSKIQKLVFVKISSHKPVSETLMVVASNDSFAIYEEIDRSDLTDTAKMLNFGARKSFFIQSEKDTYKEAFSFLLNKFEQTEFIVCESNTLRLIFEPDVFVLLEKGGNMKDSAHKTALMADLNIITDELSILSPEMILEIKDGQWTIKE